MNRLSSLIPNSTNGTWVNGLKITAAQPLKQGDKIYIADFIITLESADERSQTEGAMPRASAAPLPKQSALPATSGIPMRRSIAERRAMLGGSSLPGIQPDEVGGQPLNFSAERRACRAPVQRLKPRSQLAIR